MVLLGAATVPVAQAAVDVASISATPLRSVVTVGELGTPGTSQPA